MTRKSMTRNDDGEVVVDVPVALAELGWTDTPENRSRLCRELIERLRAECPTIRIQAVMRDGGQN